MKYLVPYDFTPITHNALQHALAIAAVESGEIVLLHIAANADEKEAAEKQFAELSAGFSADEKSKITTRVRLGDIFKDISREAEEGEADLLVMGTHGAKGLQKILGSHAIKVITSSAVPFIVTQKRGPEKDIKRIVLPVDLSHEKVSIAPFAAELAKKFKAEIHIVAKPQTDDFLKKRLQNNITKVKRLLSKEGVQLQVQLLEGKQAFHKEVIEYGTKAKADLFAVAHHPQTLIPQLEKFSQELITNEPGTPVLILNAKELVGVKSNYAFVGI